MTDETKKPEGERQVHGGFEITGILTDKRQIRMNGFVYSDDTAEDLNKRIDMLQAVIDRQLIRFDVVNKEAELAQFIASEDQLDVMHEGLKTKMEGGKKLVTTERASFDQYEQGKRFHKHKRDSLAAAIAAGRMKLNGAAPQ